MLSKEIQEQIIREISSVRFGNVRIELNETLGHVDIITERRKRIYKKKKSNILRNVIHQEEE